MKEDIKLQDTFRKYINGQLSADQVRDFLAHIQSGEDSELLQKLIEETFGEKIDSVSSNDVFLESALKKSWSAVQDQMESEPVRKIQNWRLIVGLVAILISILSVSIWFYLLKESTTDDYQTVYNPIIPGQQTATLTLADGTQIRLAETAEGQLAKDGPIVISKTADGQLLYEIQETGESASGYNVLSTARGETYKVKLPDGTQVWLNTASSLRYATNFSAFSSRNVELQGEGYFEVASNHTKPFIVYSSGQKIEVLGTRFNVSSYREDSMVSTTLLEGSVRIDHHNKKTILVPNQQFQLSSSGDFYLREVDTDRIVSWTNNEFMFDGDNIDEVMRKLERWYNVDIIYEGEKSVEKFGGVVSRFEKIEKVLQLLEKTGGVRFKIEGRSVFVFSK